MPATASTALPMIPLDPDRLCFDDVDDRLRDEADPPLPERPDDDPDFADFAEVLDPPPLDDEPDFAAVEREAEPDPFDFEELDPALLVLLGPAEDDFVFDAPPEADFEFPDDRPPVLFVADEPADDLPLEPEAVDLRVEDEDFDPDPDADFEFDADDFEPPDFDDDDLAPPDLDVVDFEAPDPELEDFLVVAMIFLRFNRIGLESVRRVFLQRMCL